MAQAAPSDNGINSEQLKAAYAPGHSSTSTVWSTRALGNKEFASFQSKKAEDNGQDVGMENRMTHRCLSARRFIGVTLDMRALLRIECPKQFNFMKVIESQRLRIDAQRGRDVIRTLWEKLNESERVYD